MEEELDLSQINPGQPPQKQPYFGDLSKTQIIYDLVQVPKEKRDKAWVTKFLGALPLAAMRCGQPQVVRGPDGFPYFQLFLPEPGVEFQSFVMDKMKDDFLLEKGFGVVVNPTENTADWVFSYGDILHYHLKKNLEYPDLATQKTSDPIEPNEQVMIGAPSEEMLPAITKKLLNELLKMNGLESPKVLLMIRQKGEGNTKHLAFNLTPQTFEDEKKYQGIMRALTWYLPRDYSILGLDEKHFENGFKPLA